MPQNYDKYQRVPVDLTHAEYQALHKAATRIGATHAGFIRAVLKEAIVNVENLRLVKVDHTPLWAREAGDRTSS